jgi:pyrroline-5-carboxylate reductase
MDTRLILIGGGKMGGALLAGWLARGLDPKHVRVVEPAAPAAEAIARQGVLVLPAPEAIEPAFHPAVVAVAVKPQMMDAALPDYARYVTPETLFLSIAAGKTIGYFRTQLGAEAHIVRAMPNTPAAIGRGISVCCAGAGVSEAQRALANELMAAVGEVAWIEEEALLDPVTAVSGGGPAYVFLLTETLAAAGKAAGLPDALAERLARATVAGSGELLHRSTEPPSALREAVTSPAGTTLEALKILMAPDGLAPLMVRAIAAATRRSHELSS